jgi:hypothetical protein
VEQLKAIMAKSNIIINNCQTEDFQLSVSEDQEIIINNVNNVGSASKIDEIIQNSDEIDNDEIGLATSINEISSNGDLSNEIVLYKSQTNKQNFQRNFSKGIIVFFSPR